MLFLQTSFVNCKTSLISGYGYILEILDEFTKLSSAKQIYRQFHQTLVPPLFCLHYCHNCEENCLADCSISPNPIAVAANVILYCNYTEQIQIEKYKSIADDLKSKSEGLEAQVLTLKKVSHLKLLYYISVFSRSYMASCSLGLFYGQNTLLN